MPIGLGLFSLQRTCATISRKEDGPMRREEALRILAENSGLCEEFGVRSLSIFGSVARDEAARDSDVDILVDYEPEAPRGYFRLFALRERLEDLLGVEVDLVTTGGLRRELRDQVLSEAIRAA
jgi:predicted nucleotidyltransferase